MKKDLIDIIICPKCRNNRLSITEDVTEYEIIIEGELKCLNCNKKFIISKGIVRLYDKFSDTAEQELKSHKKEISENRELTYFQNKDWILNFPNVKKIGIDERSERIGRLISENVEQSLKRYIKKRNVCILEIGAGNCWVTAGLAKDNYCVALDILAMPPIGLEAGNVFITEKNVYFERIVADMIKLPFKDMSFDYVLISSSLHHSPDILKTLNEIKRILSSDGELILLNEPYKGIFGSKERERAVRDVENGINEQRYAIADWKRFFTQSGFQSKIYMPENLESIIKTKGGLFTKFSGLINFFFTSKILKKYLSVCILKFLDGYCNAILSPGKNYKNKII